MEHSAGESDDGSVQADFDRQLRREFHGSRITSDAGLLAYRELDDALGLTELAGAPLSECRRSKNTATRALEPSPNTHIGVAECHTSAHGLSR